jgi:hypothetical protein
MTEASRLTGDDQQIVTQARQLLRLASSDAIREHTGYGNNNLAAFVSAFGESQEVIAGLLAIVAGLDGPQVTEAGDSP